MIFSFGEFYALSPNPKLATRRKKGNERAEQQLRIAERVARLLSAFPYVRSVAVSGSLSKNYADERSDIDFFIITAKDRLWIARTFMHFFKKITFLVGKQNWFCMNYYVDEAGLEIREKNIFTATEIITVMPLRDDSLFHEFISANEWYKNFFPYYIPGKERLKKMKSGVLKKMIEWLFNNRAGNKLDDWLMKITARRWNKKRKSNKKNSHGVLMSMDAGKHYSKPDPKHLQEKIVNRYYLKSEQLLLELKSVSTIEVVHAV
ncbi:MAG TPA: nucleotidyltransferase domain-containing protein [Chitinophagaceae bacterium]|nr:nucleotidyltransferase domain-containing protein [Chitinophagaceae bacterium]